MGFVLFAIAVVLGTGLAYGTGRQPVRGGLYCGIGFAVAFMGAQLALGDPRTAFLVAVPLGLGASFLAPLAEPKR